MYHLYIYLFGMSFHCFLGHTCNLATIILKPKIKQNWNTYTGLIKHTNKHEQTLSINQPYIIILVAIRNYFDLEFITKIFFFPKGCQNQLKCLAKLSTSLMNYSTISSILDIWPMKL